MPQLSRRSFLKTSSLVAGSFAIMPSRALAANSEIRVAVVGLRSRGMRLVADVMRTEGARLVALCDVDSAVLAEKARETEKEHGVAPDLHTSYQKVLDRKDIDAVVLATPNHWHALQTIWGCQAGKDVYVEKPVCHSVWEGQQMIAAAEKYGRIVQSGFQNRSDVGLKEALNAIAAGELGEVSLARGLCYRNRASIGRRDTPLTPPASVDYNTWLGPAQDEPIYREQFHYDWHWVWNTGNGDLGNQGPHELDLLRWALGDPHHPGKVTAFGGRFAWDDAGETPNMAIVSYDWGGKAPVLFEVRDLWVKPDLNAAPAYKDRRVGIIINTEAGELRAGRGGASLYDDEGKRIRAFSGEGGFDHFPAFIRAVNSRKESNLACTIETGYRSTCLAHLGNISYRTGSKASDKAARELAKRSDILLETYERFHEHLANWDIDLSEDRWTLGRELRFDANKEIFKGPGSAEANQLLRRAARKEFEIPQIA